MWSWLIFGPLETCVCCFHSLVVFKNFIWCILKELGCSLTFSFEETKNEQSLKAVFRAFSLSYFPYNTSTFKTLYLSIEWEESSPPTIFVFKFVFLNKMSWMSARQRRLFISCSSEWKFGTATTINNNKNNIFLAAMQFFTVHPILVLSFRLHSSIALGPPSTFSGSERQNSGIFEIADLIHTTTLKLHCLVDTPSRFTSSSLLFFFFSFTSRISARCTTQKN